MSEKSPKEELRGAFDEAREAEKYDMARVEAEALVTKISDPRLTLTEGGNFRIDRGTDESGNKLETVVPSSKKFEGEDGESVDIETFLRGQLNF